MREVHFTAYGEAKPQGSQESRFVPSLGRTVSHEKPGVYAWRKTIAWSAAKAMGDGAKLIDGPVVLEAVFFRPRPKSWPKRRCYPTSAPDLSKLVRALEDALTGVIYRDDAQIVGLHVRKVCGEPARVEVGVFEVGETPGAIGEVMAKAIGYAVSSASGAR